MGRILVYIQILLLFIVGIQEMLTDSKSLQYLQDVNLIFLLLCCFQKGYKRLMRTIKRIWPALIIVALLFAEGLISFLSNDIKLTQYLWEVRTLFRFPLFLICCISLLEYKDIFKFKKIFTYVFYINFIFSLYQYYILSVSGDNLGGIFGIGLGVNAPTLTFLSVYFAFLYRDLDYEIISIYRFIFDIVIILWITLFAEIKALIFILPIIACVQLLSNNRFTIKKTLMFSFVALAAVGLIEVYGKLYKQNTFTQEGVESYLSGGYGTGNEEIVDRSTAFMVIDYHFFSKTDNSRWFGIGMGGASDSQVFSSNDFHNKWHWTYYDWFMHSFMYLENGIIGVILYLSFWFYFLFRFWRIRKEKRVYSPEIFLSLVVVAIISFFYNSSLRLNSSYLLYLCLSMPYLVKKRRINIHIAHEKNTVCR